MSGLILLFLSFVGWFLFLAECTLWPTATIPLFSTSFFIVVLYAFSLAGFLLPGAYFLAAMGIALGVIGAFLARARYREYFSKLLEPGLALFFLLAALFWPMLSRVHYRNWDEFTHWGFAAKEIFLRNSLAPLESALPFKDYPPGTALFQYYVTFFIGWSEGATAFAQVLLLLAAAVALLQNVSWKQGSRIAAILAMSYLLPVMFGYQPQDLCVDHVLGFLFGISIASSLLSVDGKHGMLLRMIPTLLILPLIKSSGLLLALIVASVIATDHFMAARMRGDRKGLLGALCLCAVLVLSPMVSSKSWSWRMASLGVTKTLETKNISFANMWNSFSSSATERERTTILNFRRALAGKQVGRTLPPAFLLIMLALAAFVALRKETRRRENLQIQAAFLWLLVGFTIYASGLLFLYLFSFGGYEGPRLASFGRYMGIFFLGWGFVTAAFFLRLPLPPIPCGYARYARTLIILASVLMLGQNSFHEAREEKKLWQAPWYKSLRDKAAYAVSKTTVASKIYVIWQDSKGFESWVMAYELAPRITSMRNGGAWSMGKPYYSGDVWTNDISAKDWQSVLKDYDFVMIGSADRAFWDRFGALFGKWDPVGADYLFKVITDDGKIKLRPVGASDE